MRDKKNWDIKLNLLNIMVFTVFQLTAEYAPVVGTTKPSCYPDHFSYNRSPCYYIYVPLKTFSQTSIPGCSVWYLLDMDI